MSANAYRVCPRCWKKHNDQLAVSKDVESLYGKIPLEEYNIKLAQHIELNNKNLDETFREDYEIYMDLNGVLHIEYYGSCYVCKFNAKTEHRERFDLT